MYCTKCGHKLKQDDKFCGSCGNSNAHFVPLEEKNFSSGNDTRPLENIEAIEKLQQSTNIVKSKKGNKRNRLGVVLAVSASIIAILVFIVILTFTNTGTNISVDKIKTITPHDLYGTWEFEGSPNCITFKDDFTFETYYYKDSSTKNSVKQTERIYKGKWSIGSAGGMKVDENTIIFITSSEGKLNSTLQETWGSSSRAFWIKFKGNVLDTYTFEGGMDSGTEYFINPKLKKIMSQEDYTKLADHKVIQILQDAYSKEGNYKVSLISSEWNKDKNSSFISGTCNIAVQNKDIIVAPVMTVNVTFDLGKGQPPYTVNFLSMMNMESGKRANIYTLDNKNGTVSRTKERLILP